MTDNLRPASAAEISVDKGDSVRSARRSVGGLGRAARIAVGAIALAAVSDVIPALASPEAHIEVDKTRLAIARSLGRYVIPGAPRESYVLANVDANEGRVRLAGRSELAAITPENLVGSDAVIIDGEPFWVQAVQVEGGETYYYVRHKRGALCVSSSATGGEGAAVAALDKFFGERLVRQDF